ncbi:MAG: hypothetical protein J5785_07205 [Spirochaetales bacterium]|nr:hypothetical protein [Spirochaetales bacterium]
MAKNKGVFQGFLWAVAVCIISFGVIYFLVPDVSEKFFGMSFKNGDVSEAVSLLSKTFDEALKSIKETLDKEIPEQAGEVIGKLSKSDVWDKAAAAPEKAAEMISEEAQRIAEEAGYVGKNITDEVGAALKSIDLSGLMKSISSVASGTRKSIRNKISSAFK